jgi:hypothetical protein
MAMKEKFKLHYQQIGPRRFVIGTVILLTILDILGGYSFKESWINNQMSEKVVSLTIQSLQVQMTDLAGDSIAEMSGLVNNAFDFMLILILVNNLFFYFFYLKKKLWAQSYVLFYTLTASILSFTMVLDNNVGTAWTLFNLMCIPIYLYLYLGVNILKPETVNLPEKKAQ